MFLIYLPPSLVQSNQVVRFYGEGRERYERHINPTFSSPGGRNRADIYSRLRIGADIRIEPNLSARIEYQNSHDLFWTQSRNASTDNSDLSLAYVKYSTKPLTVTAGRQKDDLGEQRLFGSAEWLNLARSVDGARVQDGQWDTFAGKLGVANTKPETARFAVLTHTDKTWGTTSVLAKHDLGTVADVDEQTLDHFASVTVAGTTFSGEAALQTGSNNGKDQRAWAWHLRAAREVLPKTTLFIEGDAASGGGNATTSRTFDNQYPSNHDQYGLADLLGWKNMNEFAMRLDHRLGSSWGLRASFEAMSLRDPSDGWYSAVGTVNPRSGGTFIDKTGASGRDLGQEFDLSASYEMQKWGRLSGGIAFFDPGHFVQELSGHSNMLTSGFLQYGVKF